MIKLGHRYRHHRGDVYEVLLLATDANNDAPKGELQVVYRRLKNDQVFVRSLSEFDQSFKVIDG